VLHKPLSFIHETALNKGQEKLVVVVLLGIDPGYHLPQSK
jgi:hypothetical protein